jgi:DNA helicase-2/ATP-dependent DNA helicase PcrA
MYVAITRARRRLYLSLAQSRMLHGQTRYNIPSRFVASFRRARALALALSSAVLPISTTTRGGASPKRRRRRRRRRNGA